MRNPFKRLKRKQKHKVNSGTNSKKPPKKTLKYPKPPKPDPLKLEQIRRRYGHFMLDGDNNLFRIQSPPYCSEPIEYRGFRFVITDKPAPANVGDLVADLLDRGVNCLVLCSENLFDAQIMEENGIKTKEILIQDGRFPTPEQVKIWLETVDEVFEECRDSCIAITCNAGAGRSPVLATIGLMEAGLNNVAAMWMIREIRPFAYSYRQIDDLLEYKSSNYLINKRRKRMCTIL
ncbi:Protein tyrosine phosphatase type IVA 3 [Thelohanellus kitauei]|uniref:Protein tyrosine phosphatase type IVA 3 n=1 Tax=Thelohanellus kitauei TaxID=669202 RepID=A0A0C2IYP2_THEKT|nr:Protein tyrosine phosphatase type IVA 3 [Thelohanellus kitauei]